MCRSHSGIVRRGWDNMNGYSATMKDTNCVHLYHLVKSVLGTPQIVCIYASAAGDHRPRAGNDRWCISCAGMMSISPGVSEIYNYCFSIHLRYLVLATGEWNQPVLQVWTGNRVQFGSRPVQIPNPGCLGRVIVQTGHQPAVCWQGWSQTAVLFQGSCMFRCN